ncbi:sce7726 family protein [Neomicrococcus aestuarii]
MGNRDDYVYRTAVTQKIVLGRHSLRTATVLNEVRAGRSKADVVVLNGTSTAYEIKSERDSFRRLPQQLADYCSVFASVNVVTSPNQVEAVLQLAPEDVGVLTLSSRYRLQTVRKAVDRPERTSPVSLLETLRIDEAAQVLSLLDISYPDVPNTLRWGMLREIFAGLEATSVHSSVVRVLKSTRSCAGLEPVVKRLPVHLAVAVLSTDPSPAATRNLSTATWQPLASVLAWS